MCVCVCVCVCVTPMYVQSGAGAMIFNSTSTNITFHNTFFLVRAFHIQQCITARPSSSCAYLSLMVACLGRMHSHTTLVVEVHDGLH